MPLDPRLNAFRADLADARLSGQVTAERFVAGRPARVAVGLADVRRAPAADAPLDTQLWYGEEVTLFEESGGFGWVQAALDGYVGYVALSALAPGEGAAASHRVAVPMTFRFPRPDIKAPPLDRLPMNARLAVESEANGFLALADGGFVFARHARPLDQSEADWLAVAQRFLHAPYLWGGRSVAGLDCSALVQASLAAAGRPCPRDTYQQKDSALLGESLPPDAAPRRGDLVYSPGHVAIVWDEKTLLHGNAFHLAVAFEPLDGFLARLAARDEAPLLLRRLR